MCVCACVCVRESLPHLPPPPPHLYCPGGATRPKQTISLQDFDVKHLRPGLLAECRGKHSSRIVIPPRDLWCWPLFLSVSLSLSLGQNDNVHFAIAETMSKISRLQ